MIITDKIRNMSEPEKMKYFLNKLITLDPHTRAAKEVITIISDLAKGVPIDQFLTKFELTGKIDLKTTPATISINIDGRPDPLVISVVDPSKTDLKDAKPEEKKPIKSFLTDDEIKSLTGNE